MCSILFAVKYRTGLPSLNSNSSDCSKIGFSGIAGGQQGDIDINGDGKIDELDHFSLASFLGIEDAPIRISTLASLALVVMRLKQCFGDMSEFTDEVGETMLNRMRLELASYVEMEHTSPVGVAQVYKSDGYKVIDNMIEVILKAKNHEKRHKNCERMKKNSFLLSMEADQDSIFHRISSTILWMIFLPLNQIFIGCH